MNYLLLQKQEPFFRITKSVNQYPNTKAHTSNEIQHLENFENSTVVFDDMLLSKQESNIDLFCTRGRHQSIRGRQQYIYYVAQSYFHPPKNTIRNNSNLNIFIKQKLRDIIRLFYDIAGLDMNLDEWKELCRRAWENDYDFFTNRQIC